MSTESQSSEFWLGYFNALADDLKERLYNLEHFDSASEINAYCDDLEGQISLTYDSIVKRINQLQEKLIDEVKTYREKQLARRKLELSEASPSPKRMRFDISTERLKLIQSMLANSSIYIEYFRRKYSWLAKNEYQDSKKMVEWARQAQRQAEDHKDNLRTARQMIRDEAFGSEFMKFKPNQWSIQDIHLLGKMTTSLYESEIEKSSSYSSIKISEKPFATLASHDRPVSIVKFLSNGLLVTCASDNTLRVWNRVIEREQALTSTSQKPIIEIVELTDGRLIGGSRGGEIVLWDKAYKPVNCILAHSKEVSTLLVLPNGNVASLSMDDTIKIWNGLEEDELSLLFTMNGHGCLKMHNRLFMLPDGFLVSCSDDSGNSKVRIWDPFQGKMVRKIETGLSCVCSFALLRNNNLALVPLKGPIHLINLDNDAIRKTLSGSERDGSCWFVLELSNGHILLENPKAEQNLEIWNPESGKMMQSIKSTHSGLIHSCSVSPDRRILATSSGDRTVNLWTLS